MERTGVFSRLGVRVSSHKVGSAGRGAKALVPRRELEVQIQTDDRVDRVTIEERSSVQLRLEPSDARTGQARHRAATKITLEPHPRFEPPSGKPVEILRQEPVPAGLRMFVPRRRLEATPGQDAVDRLASADVTVGILDAETDAQLDSALADRETALQLRVGILDLGVRVAADLAVGRPDVDPGVRVGRATIGGNVLDPG